MRDAINRNIDGFKPFIVGKYVGKDVLAKDGSLVAARGQMITEDTANQAFEQNRLYDLWVAASTHPPETETEPSAVGTALEPSEPTVAAPESAQTETPEKSAEQTVGDAETRRAELFRRLFNERERHDPDAAQYPVPKQGDIWDLAGQPWRVDGFTNNDEIALTNENSGIKILFTY